MRVCASLSSASELDTPTKLVEIRLDLLGKVPEDPKGHDMIVTFRGEVDTRVLPEGFTGMIDIGEEHRPETKATVIASHHDYEGTPSAERIRSILNGMDCDIAKAAFSVNSLTDLTSILDVARSTKKRHVILGMGALGTVTRVRSDILGNEFSFGYVGEPTAPGQLSAARMEGLTDGCTVLGIVGNPLSKSKSSVMQNAALEKAGIPGIYLPFETPDLEGLGEVIRGYDIRGMNVTVPHKVDVMDQLDAVDADASAVGAVNTIVNENGRLVGHNTDVAGVRIALARAGIEVEDGRVLIMGSGGAARAVAHCVSKMGCDITVTGRNRDTGEELASEFGGAFRDPKSVSTMMYDLIVNCTPVGMYSDGPYPVDISRLQPGQAVFDAVYGKETPIIRNARAVGLKAARGEDMLAGQGAEAFRLWTGVDGMFDTMRAAI